MAVMRLLAHALYRLADQTLKSGWAVLQIGGRAEVLIAFHLKKAGSGMPAGER
jgi:hypothetical protein